MAVYERCDRCDGTGQFSAGEDYICVACEGTGFVCLEEEGDGPRLVLVDGRLISPQEQAAAFLARTEDLVRSVRRVQRRIRRALKKIARVRAILAEPSPL